MNKPRVICLCGSTRFVDTFNEWRKKLTLEGNIILAIEIVTTQAKKDDPQFVNSEMKQMLDQLHLRKIDLADEILVLNVGGYIGKSTANEIAYARQTGKPVRYLEHVQNLSKEDISIPGQVGTNRKPNVMRTKEIIIREFTMDDYEKVVALWEEAGIHYRPNGRESRSRMARELQGGQALFLVATIDKKIVGVVMGTHDGRKGWINRLAVNQDFRRQKVASQLVAAVETRLNALDIDINACLIEPENSASRTFFNKLGYTKVPVDYFSKRQSPDA